MYLHAGRQLARRRHRTARVAAESLQPQAWECITAAKLRHAVPLVICSRASDTSQAGQLAHHAQVCKGVW
jgi:hypothetical protein